MKKTPAREAVPMNALAISLCARCRFGEQITSARGSLFLLCRRSFDDPRFAKYPRLPVLACPGFEAAEGAHS